MLMLKGPSSTGMGRTNAPTQLQSGLVWRHPCPRATAVYESAMLGVRHIDADTRLSQAVFHCRVCAHTVNADTNAAKNILREELSRLACPKKGVVRIGHRETGPSDRSLKQERRSRLVA